MGTGSSKIFASRILLVYGDRVLLTKRGGTGSKFEPANRRWMGVGKLSDSKVRVIDSGIQEAKDVLGITIEKPDMQLITRFDDKVLGAELSFYAVRHWEGKLDLKPHPFYEATQWFKFHEVRALANRGEHLGMFTKDAVEMLIVPR